jgi:hypothetical protein
MQINLQDLGNVQLGEAYPGSNGTNRNSAVINLSSRITDCAAQQMNLAHEIGHTLGLDHCNGSNGDCNSQGVSIMNRGVCAQYDRRGNCTLTDFNNNTYGRTTPSNCDNQVTQQAGQYNPNTLNQYDPNPPASCDAASECYSIVGCVSCNEQCQCTHVVPSPIVIDVLGNGFALTDAANGVDFDLDTNGLRERLSWTTASADDAFLVLDRNGNEQIDNGEELFGNYTPQPVPVPRPRTCRNGFNALAVFDKPENGGNNDNQIDSKDVVFDQLRLWRDSNHNGVSETDELQLLSVSPVRVIELDYKDSRRTDEHGNQFKFRAKIRDAQGAQVGHWAWDVFLLKGN